MFSKNGKYNEKTDNTGCPDSVLQPDPQHAREIQVMNVYSNYEFGKPIHNCLVIQTEKPFIFVPKDGILLPPNKEFGEEGYPVLRNASAPEG